MRSVHEIQPSLLERYRKACIEAGIIMRFNVWEDLEFDDLTASVRATINKIEDRIQASRGAIISVLASDPSVTEKMVNDVARDDLMPKLRGKE
jgi:hypothetical protein